MATSIADYGLEAERWGDLSYNPERDFTTSEFWRRVLAPKLAGAEPSVVAPRAPTVGSQQAGGLDESMFPQLDAFMREQAGVAAPVRVDWDANLRAIAQMMGLKPEQAASLFGGGASMRSGGAGVAMPALKLTADEVMAEQKKNEQQLRGYKRTPLEVFQQADKLQALLDANKRPERKDHKDLSNADLSTALFRMASGMASKSGLRGAGEGLKAATDSAEKSRDQQYTDALAAVQDALTRGTAVIDAQGKDTGARNAEKTAQQAFDMGQLKAIGDALTQRGSVAGHRDSVAANDAYHRAQLAQQATQHAEARRDAALGRDPRLQLLSQAALYASGNNLDMSKPVDAKKVFDHLKQFTQPKAEKAQIPNEQLFSTMYNQLVTDYGKKGTPEAVSAAARRVAAGVASGQLDPTRVDEYIVPLLKTQQR